MFGLQASGIIQKFRSAGQGVIGGILAGIIGDCEQSLEHNGPVMLNGPTDMNGPVKFSGPVDFGNPTNGNGFLAAGILAEELTRDGTAAVNLVTGGQISAGGYFIKTNKKASVSDRVGLLNFPGLGWQAIVDDNCLVNV